MIRLRDLNRYRRRDLERERYGEEGDDFCGVFVIPSAIHGVRLQVIAGNGDGWDHVSVSTNLPRCPTWAEMEFIKRMFFKPDEVAMQLHVATSDHISIHPYVLHIWRPHDYLIPLPPRDFV